MKKVLVRAALEIIRIALKIIRVVGYFIKDNRARIRITKTLKKHCVSLKSLSLSIKLKFENKFDKEQIYIQFANLFSLPEFTF